MITLKKLFPESLRCRIADMRGRGIYKGYADEFRCIFIHIPKAAGTSVAKTLFATGSRHVRYTKYERANPKKFEQYFKFSFVRNPWDRLYSAYSFLKKGGMIDMDRVWAAEHLASYSDFGSFVRGWVNEENIQTWVHFLPQCYFICDSEGKVMMDFVGRMENMENDFAYVADRLGCTKNLAKVNTGNNRHYSTYYDEETREIVRRVYARDIELFGYSFEDKVVGA